MVAIIDYGMGNLASVQKALSFLNIDSTITNDEILIKEASHIILPGVGSFEQGMINLKKLNLIEVLNREVIINKKPFFGICLGMQLIMEKGNEPKSCEGLGWIKGSVELINNKKLPVPHLGWNRVYNNESRYSEDKLIDNFYFIHSYHVVPKENVIETYVDYEFPMVASILTDNIFATQFHPEKSQKAGLQLLKKYFKLNA